MMHSSSSTPSSFSMLFSKPYDHHDSYNHYDRHDNSYDNYYHYDHSDTYSFSNPGVDCTLSLGTPSTRLSPDDETDNPAATTKRSSRQSRNDKRRSSDSSSRVSNFCWDLFQPKHHSTNQQTTSYKHNNRVPNHNNNNNNSNSNASNNDPLSARRCANCDTTSTPLWRNGPRGPKSLCNACGIRFKKEERRATAAAANPAAPIDQPSGHVYGQHYNNMNQYLNNNNSNNNWNNFQQYSHYSQPQKNNFNNDQFRFIDNEVDTVDTGISFLSWRLNVTDRPSLVHDFTR